MMKKIMKKNECRIKIILLILILDLIKNIKITKQNKSYLGKLLNRRILNVKHTSNSKRQQNRDKNYLFKSVKTKTYKITEKTRTVINKKSTTFQYKSLLKFAKSVGLKIISKIKKTSIVFSSIFKIKKNFISI